MDRVKNCHICFVAPLTYPVIAKTNNIPVAGGAEVQQSIIAKSLVKAGIKVSVISMDYGQTDGETVDGVYIYKAHKEYAGMPIIRFIHPNITSFWSAMRRVDADIYYQRGAAALTGIVAAFCKKHKKKMVFASATDTDLIPGQQLMKYRRDKMIYEYGLKSASKVITQSEKQKRLCRDNYNIESEIIENCYEPEDLESKASPCDVIWIGRVVDDKNPIDFLNIAKRMPEWKFKMIGGAGGEKKTAVDFYDQIKAEANKINNLDFIGFVPYIEIDSHINSCKILMSTSVKEGFPNIFLQAWARRIPTVSFLDSDFLESDEPIGIYVDGIDKACNEIYKILSNQQMRDSIGKVCQNYYKEKHSVETVTQKYLNLLEAMFNK